MIFTIARSQKQMPFGVFYTWAVVGGIPKGGFAPLGTVCVSQNFKTFKGINFEKRLNVLCEAKGLLDVY